MPWLCGEKRTFGFRTIVLGQGLSAGLRLCCAMRELGAMFKFGRARARNAKAVGYVVFFMEMRAWSWEELGLGSSYGSHNIWRDRVARCTRMVLGSKLDDLILIIIFKIFFNKAFH